MVIARYLKQEVFKTFVAVLSVLLLIATSNKLVKLFGLAASGEISPALLIKIIGMQLPDVVAFILPLSFFISILLTFGRAFVDQELTVFFACGNGWWSLLKILMGLAFWNMVFVCFLTTIIVPKFALNKERLLATEESVVILDTLVPGRFYSFHRDRLVFYVEKLSDDRKKLKQVFIAEHPLSNLEEDDSWTVLSATQGTIKTDKKTGNTYVQLNDGIRYEGIPGEKSYGIIEFAEFGKLIERKPPKNGIYYHHSMPTKMLWQLGNSSNIAELQWRLSLPLSVFILGLLAVPLSRVRPRSGRFAKLLPGIIVFIIYYNLLTMSKRWIASGVIPTFVGVWWVHALMLIIALLLMARSSGRGHQFWSYVKGKVLG